MRIVRTTPLADDDIVDILVWSEEQFGASVQARYARLIDTAVQDVASDPNRLGSRPRPEVAGELRTYHLAFSRERGRGPGGIVRHPRHVLVYRLPDDDHIEIVRVLHDAMDVARHLPDDLTSDA